MFRHSELSCAFIPGFQKGPEPTQGWGFRSVSSNSRKKQRSSLIKIISSVMSLCQRSTSLKAQTPVHLQSKLVVADFFKFLIILVSR